jgi:hypothetical protein
MHFAFLKVQKIVPLKPVVAVFSKKYSHYRIKMGDVSSDKRGIE